MSRKRRGPRALADAIGDVTARFCDRRGFADGAVIAHWPAIVGDRLAAETAPERIKYPPKRSNGGTLTLRVANSGLALELQHLQQQLIERINDYLGRPAVARVTLIHGPVAGPPQRQPVSPPSPLPQLDPRMAALVARVDDPRLRKALETLGRSIRAREHPM